MSSSSSASRGTPASAALKPQHNGQQQATSVPKKQSTLKQSEKPHAGKLLAEEKSKKTPAAEKESDENQPRTTWTERLKRKPDIDVDINTQNVSWLSMTIKAIVSVPSKKFQYVQFLPNWDLNPAKYRDNRNLWHNDIFLRAVKSLWLVAKPPRSKKTLLPSKDRKADEVGNIWALYLLLKDPCEHTDVQGFVTTAPRKKRAVRIDVNMTNVKAEKTNDKKNGVKAQIVVSWVDEPSPNKFAYCCDKIDFQGCVADFLGSLYVSQPCMMLHESVDDGLGGRWWYWWMIMHQIAVYQRGTGGKFGISADPVKAWAEGGKLVNGYDGSGKMTGKKYPLPEGIILPVGLDMDRNLESEDSDGSGGDNWLNDWYRRTRPIFHRNGYDHRLDKKNP
ncbi:hypothetical protein B0H63DRAFT_548885 [Podospora didyma]|uniref:Uncharacterized protein n=1 Tax=Podospora didyma TaxID=330526 RepID=A0AAE0N8E2_9PEZI|nr:hypothetical protein B0H63DRAFT_548885 [Podospora didyma]